MATSGFTNIAVTAHDTLKFSWTLGSQSIADNSSVVNWKLELIAGAYGQISSSASKNWNVTVNGTQYSGTNTVGIGNNATKTLASGSTTIAHNSDGTKTFSYSFSQYFGITFSGSFVGTKAGSGSGTLTTIPRKSTMSASNGTLGTEQVLTVTKKATSFSHTIKYVCGNYSGTIANKSTATSIKWTPPIEFANGAPNGTSVYISLSIETFNGSTSIGTNSYSISCGIPASVKPSVSFSVSDALGHFSKYGAYVQGKSKFKVEVTSAGMYGSRIVTNKVIANGVSYNSASVETDVVAKAGAQTISVAVTDSRGRTATASQNVSAVSYSVPKINSMTVRRTDSAGNNSSGGAYLTVLFNATVSAINSKNTATYILKYKKKSASSYTSVTLTAYANTYAVSNGKYTFPADTASSYDVVLSVKDDFTTIEKEGFGSSMSQLFSILSRGLGFAVGKVAELADTFEVAFETMFHKSATFKNTMAVYMENASGTKRNVMHMNQSNAFNLGYGGYVANEGVTNVYGNKVAFLSKGDFTFNGATLDDFVVETGTSGIWTYRKWNSGLVECWGKYSVSDLACTTALGNMYRTAVFQPTSFPFTISSPYVFADYESAGYGAFLWATTNASTTAPPSYYLVRPTSSNGVTGTVIFYVKGKWK